MFRRIMRFEQEICGEGDSQHSVSSKLQEWADQGWQVIAMTQKDDVFSFVMERAVDPDLWPIGSAPGPQTNPFDK